MSNAIEFLEALGRLPALHGPGHAPGMPATEGLDEVQRALLYGDADALNDLAGGREMMRCLILAPNRDLEPH